MNHLLYRLMRVNLLLLNGWYSEWKDIEHLYRNDESHSLAYLDIGQNLDKVDPSFLEYTVHKIAHAAAGCLAGAIQKSCEAGAIGAAVGEIVAGLMMPDGKTAKDLTSAEKRHIKDTSRLIAGTTAAFAGFDVNIAANSADVAVENNSFRILP